MTRSGQGGTAAVEPPQPKPRPEFTLQKAFHDFGTIKEGEQVTTIFPFTNTGTADLVIELVSGCHCSIIEWPEGQVYPPGKGGEIKVTFDSNREDDMGELNKVIDVLLEHTDPKTGYQIIKEIKYRVKIVE